MIRDLLAGGRRVRIPVNSHKVISYLVDAVCEAVAGPPVEVPGVQKVNVANRVVDAGRPQRRVTRRGLSAAKPPDTIGSRARLSAVQPTNNPPNVVRLTTPVRYQWTTPKLDAGHRGVVYITPTGREYTLRKTTNVVILRAVGPATPRSPTGIIDGVVEVHLITRATLHLGESRDFCIEAVVDYIDDHAGQPLAHYWSCRGSERDHKSHD